MDSPSFTVSRTLLNPKFEGYRLDPLNQEDCVARYDLAYKPSQIAISGKSTFSFQEVQSRITHNHLAICDNAPLAAYVDSSYKVILVRLEPESLDPVLQVLAELPTPISREGKNNEYPSLAFLSESLLFVSDGLGILYAIPVKEQSLSQPIGTFVIPASSETPFRIHSAHKISPISATVLISCRSYGSSEDSTNTAERKRQTLEFDVYAVKIELLSLRPSNDIREMTMLWHYRGDDVPLYTTYEESTQSYLVIGGSKFKPIGQAPQPPYEPTPDEIAPIPRAGETLDAPAAGPAKPPPYSWTQTSDSVTVAIPLPSNTPKHVIKVLFSPTTLTVHVNSDIETSIPIPRYTTKALWAGISPSTSYWTWDREAEHDVGLLTLYMDKQHEGTRWSHVFQSAGTKGEGSLEEDLEVPETLDPSELWQIREALEKYTAALRSGEDASGLGLGRGVPSLAEGEMDMEVDGSVGRQAYLTWVGADGGPLSSSPDAPIQLLSTPLPGCKEGSPSVIIKSDVDGAVFTIEPHDSEAKKAPTWIHKSTFSALSFVLASKRDTRFTYHTSKAAYAFEGGVRDRGGNVYIYRASAPTQKWGKQAILKVADGKGGSLLGVGALQTAAGYGVLVCLTEGELVLIKDF